MIYYSDVKLKPEIITRQQRYWKNKTEKKLEKLNLNIAMKTTKKDCKNESRFIQKINWARKKRESMLEIGNGICLKKKKKRTRKTTQTKYVWRRQIINEKIHERMLERMQKKSIQQCVEENKRKWCVEKCWSWCGEPNLSRMK